MQQSVWDELKDVFHAQIGDTWGDYVSALAQDAYALYTMGRSVTDVQAVQLSALPNHGLFRAAPDKEQKRPRDTGCWRAISCGAVLSNQS